MDLYQQQDSDGDYIRDLREKPGMFQTWEKVGFSFAGGFIGIGAFLWILKGFVDHFGK